VVAAVIGPPGSPGRRGHGLLRALRCGRGAQFYLVGALGVRAAASGDASRAARLFGATERLRTETGAEINPVLAPLLEEHRIRLRDQLGEESYQTRYAAGAATSRTDAIRLALGPARDQAEPDRPGPLAPLAPRETEVARLIGEGFSNRQIGTRLFISERTVENHVRNVMDKLGFTSRTQIAAWVALAGLTTTGGDA